MASYNDEINSELIDTFIGEATEMLDIMESELLSSSVLNIELINKMFRPIHTLKGISGSFGFETITRLTHSAEALLTYLRNEQVEINKEKYLSIFLRTFDLVRDILCQISSMKNDDGFDMEVSQLVEDCDSILNGIKGKDNSGNLKPAKKMDDLPVDANVEKSEKEGPAEKQDEQFRIEITPDLIDAFKSESRETINSAEQYLLALLSSPDDMELIENTFRDIHSFKGNCGIFGLRDLEKLSHKIETCLDKIRQGERVRKIEIFEFTIRMIDVIRNRLSGYSATESKEIEGLDNYLRTLDFLSFDYTKIGPRGIVVFDDPFYTQSTDVMSTGVMAAAGDGYENGGDKNGGDHGNGTATADNRRSRNENQYGKTHLHQFLQQDIRVSTQKLDKLNNLMGELVTAKTMLLTNLARIPKEQYEYLDKAISFLGKTINDIQDVSVDIRMTPISSLFKKIIRIVHDLSRKSGKNINLEFFGEETEIDKTLIEKLSDPLVHMIRNSIDHGIESVQARRERGKSDHGTITLGAKQEGGEIWLTVEDDGNGLDREKILSKARSLGLIDGDGSDLKDSEVFQFIYHAGFSTADRVTDVSGRGVGMDVVAHNIRLLRGSIDIRSVREKGTKFILRVPLTLA
ncbi:MAG: chemotaxis protein CheA, partial [Oligoflexales bacterium]|nr:chemotaxis protein CheA [Oligoflexales bacterium]